MDLVFDEQEYQKRKSKLVETLNADFNIIFNRPDLFYYSNTGFDGAITISEDVQRYVRRNHELAATESVLPVHAMDSFRVFKDIAKGIKPQTVGLELDLVPYRTVEYIQNAFGNPEIVDISTDLRMIRSVKSDAEQEMMKKAMKQTDDSFNYIADKIKPGMTELEISADIEYFLRKEGHPGFVNVRMFHHNLTSLAYVMAGESTATLNSLFGPVSGQGLCKIHKNGPSKRKFKEDEAVLIDTTGVVEGYTGDETRTFFVGKPDQKLLDAYEVAKAVQNRAEKILKAGAKPNEVFDELNQVAREMDMYDHFMGNGSNKVAFIGHGVGLELDEFPIITDKYEYQLEEGNIIAIEPKLIFDNPRSGVGIEDCYIVKENGAERITLHPW